MNYGIQEILTSGQVGTEFKQIREQRELVTERWKKFGLLNNVEGHMAENIAQLYENQASYFLNESTDSSSSGSFETVAFPIIRRVFQKLLANEIVSVQAMNMPIGRLYFMNPKMSTRDSSVNGSATNQIHYVFDGVYRNAAETPISAKTQFSTTTLYDDWYNIETLAETNSSMFDRTKGSMTVITSTIQMVDAFANTGTGRIRGRVTGFTTTNEGKLVQTVSSGYSLGGPVGLPIDTEEFLMSLRVIASQDLNSPIGASSVYSITAGNPVPYRFLLQKYATELVRKGTDYVTLEINTDGPNSATGAYGTTLTAATPSSITFSAVYRTYSSMEEDARIPQVTFTMDFADVTVTTRKIGATYTPELQQDLNAFHSIDVEAELTALLSEVVSGEIDREILRDLRNGAGHVTMWDYGAYDRRQSGTLALTRKDFNQELITKVNQISAAINKVTLRGGANFIVCSPEVQAVLNDLDYFHATDASPDETKFSLGIEKVGSIQNRYTVYVDAYAPAGVILVGHKGDSLFHSGYIYAPYVPLMILGGQNNFNSADFKPLMGMMTRYAKKMVNNRYYGKVLVQNLPTISVSEFL